VNFAHLDTMDQIVWVTVPSPVCCMELVMMESMVMEVVLIAKEELLVRNANNALLQVPTVKIARTCVKILVLRMENVIRVPLELDAACHVTGDILESTVKLVLQSG